MDDAHRQFLKRNRVQLARELHLEELCQFLVENGVLSDHMVEKIQANQTTFSRNVAFLNMLPTRGPKAFDAFLQALLETDQGHLADILKPGIAANGLDNMLPSCTISSPSSFSFPSSTPEKNANPILNLSISPQSFHLNNTGSASPIATPPRGPKRPILTENNECNILQSSPMKGTDAGPNHCAHMPVEHMDTSGSSSPGGPHTPKRKFDPHSSFESLRSYRSYDTLYSTAGLLPSNSQMTNTADNHISSSSPSYNHTDAISTALTSNTKVMQLVTDSPNIANITVRRSTTEFFHKYYEDCYPMFKECKGLALIISVTKYEPSACLDDRHGGEKDCALMELVLKQLSYEVYQLSNGTAFEIWNTLKNFAEWVKHKDQESCFIVLMSHGEDGVIFGRDGKAVPLNDAYNLFSNKNCPLLQNKPKIFLVQSCRGNDPDKGVDQIDGPTAERNSCKRRRRDEAESMEGVIKNKLPTLSDMLIAYATVPGYAAMRNTERGSWFIQAFIQVVAFHAQDKHMLDLMTMTNNQVKGREGWSPDSEFHRCKEMSVFSSCLCKPLYFFPGLCIKTDGF